MVELRNGTIRIDGTPTLLLGGEIHYFRLPRDTWQDRIDRLREAGGNCVASYVPWLCHQPEPGPIDLAGHTRPELDLWGFMDLCRDNGLHFFLRPGPFIMAEMKNEGIPYWVYERHPEIVPSGWDGTPCPTRTVDLLAPGFLSEARAWYRAVMAGAAPRSRAAGGNLVGIQLDNEIGMLSWVSNSPDLTDGMLRDFAGFLQARYGPAELARRHPALADGEAAFRRSILSPEDARAVPSWHDLAAFHRERYARYVATLRSWALEDGLAGVPFLVNVHGTGGGRATSFPIGISQLQAAYSQSPDLMAGSDLYLGNLDRNTFQDLYLANALLLASVPDGAPIGSVEFEAGSGDYGQTLGGYDDGATDRKLRMCAAQGNRFLNLYLFAGGYNRRMDRRTGDGSDRIAFTGGRHGFAAPVDPEGRPNRTFAKTARSLAALGAVADLLAEAEEEADPLVYGFLPDDFETECRYPGSLAAADFVRALERTRSGHGWETVVRSLLLAGFRFRARDLRRQPLRLGEDRVLLMPTARFMAPEIQEDLAAFLRGGGRALLFGELPLFDRDGAPCRILADALSVQPLDFRSAGPDFFPSVQPEGLASIRDEFRVGWAWTHQLPPTADALFRLYPDGAPCGFDVRAGQGRAVVLATDAIGQVALYRELAARLGIAPGLAHDHPDDGIWMTATRLPGGGRLLHLLNLDDSDKAFHVRLDGRRRFGGGRLILPARAGLLLPLDLPVRIRADSGGDIPEGPPDAVLVFSTAEFAARSGGLLAFRCRADTERIVLRTRCRVSLQGPGTLRREGDRVTVHARGRPDRDRIVRIRLA